MVDCFTQGEQLQLVKETEYCEPRLMDGKYNCPPFLGQTLEKNRNNFVKSNETIVVVLLQFISEGSLFLCREGEKYDICRRIERK